jgi:hypothetical protein
MDTTDPFDPFDPLGLEATGADPAPLGGSFEQPVVDYDELLGGSGGELGGLLNDTYAYIEETEAWVDDLQVAPAPIDPGLVAPSPVDHNALLNGDPSGLGDLLNVAHGTAAESRAFIDGLEVDAPIQDQGFGLNTAAGQAMNIVNTHMAAADDVLEGDFAAAERIAGWTPFLSAHNAGEDAWDSAMSTYRDPFEKIVEGNVSHNEYTAWAEEVAAMRNAQQVEITAANAESRAAWAVWVSRLFSAIVP